MRTAFLDANILYSAPLRDLFVQLAEADIFQARWSDDIHQEWMTALLRNEPWRDPVALDRTRHRMDAAVRGCLVTGYWPLVPRLMLPDPNDRHVLAAAVVGDCEVIVTKNLDHFPSSALAPLRIEAQHPDEFLLYHLNVDPDSFCEAVRQLRARLVNPPYTVNEYLGTLTQQGLAATVARLGTRAYLL